MNIYLIIILAALIGSYLLQTTANILNITNLKKEVPDEFKDICDKDLYIKTLDYTVSKTKFTLLTSTFSLALILIFILFGGFNYIDIFVRSFTSHTILQGLCFFGLLFILNDIINIPFSLYFTFVIEEKFGFNKTDIKTFIIDKIKSYVLVIILGTIIIGVILFFFEKTGSLAWVYTWGFVSAFIIIAQPIFTMFIAPFFNKFSPLQDGELKQRIEKYAAQVNFPIKEISVMDGSKRSSHSNAYFSGLGKKRIALFDTLIEKHTNDELLAIMGHEIGHYKKHHNIKNIFIAIIHSGILLYMLSIFINNKGLFEAFQMRHLSIYASLIFFSLLYTPVEIVLSILMNMFSRKFEYEADTFSAKTTDKDSMIAAYKRLVITNLSQLTPHKLYVFLNYSHPAPLDRIKALKNMDSLSTTSRE